jgi:hypothetical protein
MEASMTQLVPDPDFALDAVPSTPSSSGAPQVERLLSLADDEELVTAFLADVTLGDGRRPRQAVYSGFWFRLTETRAPQLGSRDFRPLGTSSPTHTTPAFVAEWVRAGAFERPAGRA